MKLSSITNPDIEEPLREDAEYILKHKILKGAKTNSLSEYLIEEEEKLEQLIEVLEKDEETLNGADEITAQIDTLMAELDEINHINLKKLKKLKEIIKIENNSSASICYIRTEERPKLRKQEILLFQKKQMLENNAQKETLLRFLKHTILKLEQKQLAESIEQVPAAKKQKSFIINCIFIIKLVFQIQIHNNSKFSLKKTLPRNLR